VIRRSKLDGCTPRLMPNSRLKHLLQSACWEPKNRTCGCQALFSEYTLPVFPHSLPSPSEGALVFSQACPFCGDEFMTNGDWEMSAKSKLMARYFLVAVTAPLG
jgi:hypothetical protein